MSEVSRALFEPIKLRGLEVRNRIWVPPMCQYVVDKQDGVPVAWHLMHYGSFARGGAGGVIVEATGVVPEGRISPQDLGLWNDHQRDAFAPIVELVHAQGAKLGIQLAHAGRKGSVYREWGTEAPGTSVPVSEGGWQTVAPSAVAFPAWLSLPHWTRQASTAWRQHSPRPLAAPSTRASTSCRCMALTAIFCTNFSRR